MPLVQEWVENSAHQCTYLICSSPVERVAERNMAETWFILYKYVIINYSIVNPTSIRNHMACMYSILVVKLNMAVQCSIKVII